MSKVAIFKFNGGNLALLCSNCYGIIKTGSTFTTAELKAVHGRNRLKPRICAKCKQRNKIRDFIYNYKTIYPEGFINTEIEEILKLYPNINMDKFNDAMMGNTCMLRDNNIINYHCDIYNAIISGVENRKLTIGEWD